MAIKNLEDALMFPTTASIEEVEYWLSIYINCQYNGAGAFSHNGTYRQYDCQTVGSLNARYRELKGIDYPGYKEKQEEMLKFFTGKNKSSKTFYNDLMEDLKKYDSSRVFQSTKHPIFRLDEIVNNLDKASAEEIGQILDIYKGKKYLNSRHMELKPIIADGCGYIMNYDPIVAATLNNRYRALTGHDHSGYVTEQRRVLEKLVKNRRRLFTGLMHNNDVYEKLLSGLDKGQPRIEIVSTAKEYGQDSDIMMHPEKYDVAEIDKVLSRFNGKAIVAGIVYHGLKDPIIATRVNSRYRELTGQDHPKYLSEMPKILREYFKERDLLESHYPQGYYAQLEGIANSLGIDPNAKERSR